EANRFGLVAFLSGGQSRRRVASSSSLDTARTSLCLGRPEPMFTRTTLWTAATLLAAFAALTLTSPAPAEADARKEAASSAPKVEVVFCLDTTGSMKGLLDRAKEKIWSISNSIAGARPSPELKIGLVAFRDRGDDYVTKVYDLTDDLDE